LIGFDDAHLDSNKVNTTDRCGVFQCNQCFYIDAIIYGLGQQCQICMDRVTCCVFDKCGHTVCLQCSTGITHNICFFCRSSNNGLTPITDAKPSHQYFFDQVNPTVKKILKKLYCQVFDTIGKSVGSNNLYDLCAEYYKFLMLLHLNNNNETVDKLSPPHLIDSIWHEHLMDNESYANLCGLIGGHVLFHYPENSFRAGIDGYDKRFSRTIDLYEKTYGTAKPSWIWYPTHTRNPRKTIQLFVKTQCGKTMTIDTYGNASTYEIMELIEKKEGIPTNQQKLVFSGKLLDMDKSISVYGIQNGSTLHFSLKLRGC